MDDAVQKKVEAGLDKTASFAKVQAQRVQDFTGDAVDLVRDAPQHVKKLKQAPKWALSLWLTDWVSLACMAPIITGLVVYVVYLWDAQQNFNQILDLIDASGGLSTWIAAYFIFLVVTLPLVCINLAYVLGMVLAECMTKGAKTSRTGGMSSMSSKQYKIFRWLLVALMALQYAGVLWLTAQLVATAILLIAAYGLDGATNATIDFYQDTYEYYNSTYVPKVENLNVTLNSLSNAAYNANVTVNGTTMNVGQTLNSALLKSFGGGLGLGLRSPPSNTTVCPEFCINLSFLQRMMGLNMDSTCICSPETINEMGALAQDSEGKLVAACIGIILMIMFWVIMMMRLAGTHDVLRVKFQLQAFLAEAGFGSREGSVASLAQGDSQGSTLMAGESGDLEAGLGGSKAPPPASSAKARWLGSLCKCRKGVAG